jgi:hypothetical protein
MKGIIKFAGAGFVASLWGVCEIVPFYNPDVGAIIGAAISISCFYLLGLFTFSEIVFKENPRLLNSSKPVQNAGIGASSVGLLWLVHYGAQHLTGNAWLAASVPLVLSMLVISACRVYNGITTKKADELRLKQVQEKIDLHRQKVNAIEAPDEGPYLPGAQADMFVKAIREIQKDDSITPEEIGIAMHKLLKEFSEEDVAEVERRLEAGSTYRTNGNPDVLDALKDS